MISGDAELDAVLSATQERDKSEYDTLDTDSEDIVTGAADTELTVRNTALQDIEVDEDLYDTLDTDSEEKEHSVILTALLNQKTSGKHLTSKLDLSKRALYKNLVVISVSFLLLFAAFQSLQNLQSSINVADGLGNVGLTVVYVSFLVSCIFLPPLMLSKVGMKRTMVISMLAYISYISAAFHATWLTVIPTSVLLGIFASTLWTGQMSFVAELATKYADVTRSNLNESCSQFFGIFYAIYHTGDIWGNLVSSLVFSYKGTENVTDGSGACGTSFCPQEESGNKNLLVTDNSKIYIYCGICLAFAVLALIIMEFLMDDLKSHQASNVSSLKLLTETGSHFWESGYQKLLVIVTVYRGLSPSFLMGDFNAAFTSCYLGVQNVGYIMVCYGICSSVSAYILAWLTRVTGYHLPFTIAFILQGSTGLAFFLWTPSIEEPIVFYVFVCLWSVGNAVYATVLSPLYSNLFPGRTDAAMSCFNLFSSMGWVISFGLSSFVCTRVKMILVLLSLVIATICVQLVVLHDRRYGIILHDRRYGTREHTY